MRSKYQKVVYELHRYTCVRVCVSIANLLSPNESHSPAEKRKVVYVEMRHNDSYHVCMYVSTSKGQMKQQPLFTSMNNGYTYLCMHHSMACSEMRHSDTVTVL